jgi:RNA ligase
MFYLPTFEEACKIVENNDAFSHTICVIDGHKFHNFGYKLPSYQDFADPLKDGSIQAWELRGLTFIESPDGKFTRHLLLNKFHCLNQTRGSMYNDIKNKEIIDVTDKRDGSIIRFLPLNDRIIAKSKGSFDGPHCDMALELLNNDPILTAIVRASFVYNQSMIFEMTGPMNEVVLKYEKPELRLIQIRNELTGDYYNLKDVASNSPYLASIMVDNIDVGSVDELIAMQQTFKNIEGWVVRFSDGQLIKIKSNWYEDMHRHLIEKNRSTKTFVEMTINETMDDAISFMEEGDIRSNMEEVMTKVSSYFNKTVNDVVNIANTFEGDVSDKNAKSVFANMHKDKPNFGLYMFAINNKENKLIENHVKRVILSQCKTEKDALNFVNNL